MSGCYCDPFTHTWTLTSHEACLLADQIQLPDGIKLFDIHVNPNKSFLVFLETPWGRSTLAIAPGDDPFGRFHKLLEDTIMAKERGIPADASKKIKKMDEAKDKKMGVKEGSKKDLAMDRALLKREGYKPKKGGKK